MGLGPVDMGGGWSISTTDQESNAWAFGDGGTVTKGADSRVFKGGGTGYPWGESMPSAVWLGVGLALAWLLMRKR